MQAPSITIHPIRSPIRSRAFLFSQCNTATMGRLSVGRRWHIVHLHSAGRSPAEIAKKVRCSTKSVYFWLARYRQTGGVDIMHTSGRPVALNTEARRRAVELLTSGEVGDAKAVARKLKDEKWCDRVLSITTVLRCAREQAKLDGDPLLCLRGRPTKCLTQDTKNKRLAFAHANKNRNWRRVMFTDRCKFLFRYPGCKVKRTRWSLKSKRHEGGAFQPTHPSALNVYAGVTAYGVTAMHAVTGTTGLTTNYKNMAGQGSRSITSDEYRHVGGTTLLPDGKRIFGQKGETQWVLQQDGDPTHPAIKPVINEFNKTSGNQVTLLKNWPPNSPDLSPIENVWGWVQAEVAKKGCKSFDEFKQEVIKTFKNIPIEMCEHLIDSVPARLERVVKTNGGKAGY